MSRVEIIGSGFSGLSASCLLAAGSHVVYKKSYAHRDFVTEYNAFKGTAYGMANTLFQTANFRPSIVNKRVGNLFYTGQLTIPGPGIPTAIISGQVVATNLIKTHGELVN